MGVLYATRSELSVIRASFAAAGSGGHGSLQVRTTRKSAVHLPDMPSARRIHEHERNKLDGSMQTYVLMTKLSPESSKQVKKRAKLGRAWLEEVKEKCPEVHFVSHYALLGRYDFLDIFEAPDEETAAKVSMISLSNGAFQAESLIAIPYKRFIELTEDL